MIRILFKKKEEKKIVIMGHLLVTIPDLFSCLTANRVGEKLTDGYVVQ